MSLILLIGGARSGKSELALRLATQQRSSVVFIATAQPGDPEMTERIALHRRERPALWQTIEEPLRLRETLADTDGLSCMVIDCLTLWTANALDQLGEAETRDHAAAAAKAACIRQGLTIVVTNEVGLGLVPDNSLGRKYRDLLGRVNAIWAEAADQVFLLVAGRALALEKTDVIGEGLQ